MSVTCIKADARTVEAKHWSDWLGKLPEARENFRRWDPELESFEFNEVSSVAVLHNAACQSGFVTQMEYVCDKRSARRGRPYVGGRVDLWVGDIATKHSWAFEFKQTFVGATCSPRTLANGLVKAMEDAYKVDPKESDWIYGSLIVVPNDDVLKSAKYKNQHDDYLSNMDAACFQACEDAKRLHQNGGSSFCWRIGGGTRPIWLLFKQP